MKNDGASGIGRDALRPSRATRANEVLAVLCLMYFVMYIDRVNIATLAPRISTDLRLSNTEFGIAVSAFAYPYALFQLIGGWLGDRLGPRRTLIVCGAIVCVATIACGFVGGLGTLIAARIVLGFGEGSAFPTATRAMALWMPAKRWGFAQGITHAASRLGNALTPALLAGLLAYTSWRGTFVILGLISLVWVAAWWAVLRSRPQVEAHEAAQAIDTKSDESARIPWFKLARRMLPVTAVDFCYGWTLWVFLTWLPSFFFQNFHLDLKHSALFSSGVLLGGLLGDAVGGYVSDLIYRRTGSLQVARRNLIIVGMMGAFFFLIPVVISHHLATVAICLSGACFFSELVVSPIWAVPMDIAPRYVSSASGMMNFGFGLAGIMSPVVFGGLIDLAGSWTVPFWASIFLLVVGSGLSFFMRPDRPFEVSQV
jgi:MFS family permease